MKIHNKKNQPTCVALRWHADRVLHAWVYPRDRKSVGNDSCPQPNGWRFKVFQPCQMIGKQMRQVPDEREMVKKKKKNQLRHHIAAMLAVLTYQQNKEKMNHLIMTITHQTFPIFMTHINQWIIYIFWLRHFKSISVSNLKSERKTPSSSINLQDPNKNVNNGVPWWLGGLSIHLATPVAWVWSLAQEIAHAADTAKIITIIILIIIMSIRVAITCPVLVTESIDGLLHNEKSNELDLFPGLCSPGKRFPNRRIHLNCGEKTASTYSCHGCDKRFIAFSFVLRAAPPFSSFSSLLLSPTHLCGFWQRKINEQKHKLSYCLHTSLRPCWQAGLPVLSYLTR